MILKSVIEAIVIGIFLIFHENLFQMFLKYTEYFMLKQEFFFETDIKSF